VNKVSGGEVGFGDDWHTESMRETACGVCCVGAPELNVMEAFYFEPVCFWVGSDEMFKPN